MFLSDCIVILLSALYYISKSTDSLKYYNIDTALQFPYKLYFIGLFFLWNKFITPANIKKAPIIPHPIRSPKTRKVSMTEMQGKEALHLMLTLKQSL